MNETREIRETWELMYLLEYTLTSSHHNPDNPACVPTLCPRVRVSLSTAPCVLHRVSVQIGTFNGTVFNALNDWLVE